MPVTDLFLVVGEGLARWPQHFLCLASDTLCWSLGVNDAEND